MIRLIIFKIIFEQKTLEVYQINGKCFFILNRVSCELVIFLLQVFLVLILILVVSLYN